MDMTFGRRSGRYWVVERRTCRIRVRRGGIGMEDSSAHICMD